MNNIEEIEDSKIVVLIMKKKNVMYYLHITLKI